jgi:hypothetical protein
LVRYDVVIPKWLHDPKVQIVKYEALVCNPEAELRSVCDFIGESYEPIMLNDRTEATVPMPAAEMPDTRLERWRREHQKKTLAEISIEPLTKWRRELSIIEIRIIEKCCAKGMLAAEYSPSRLGSSRIVASASTFAVQIACNMHRRL